MAATALKYEAEVEADGSLELSVPLPPGTRVTVFVIQEPVEGAAEHAAEDYAGLVQVAEANLQFWDNPEDDADWNDA